MFREEENSYEPTSSTLSNKENSSIEGGMKLQRYNTYTKSDALSQNHSEGTNKKVKTIKKVKSSFCKLRKTSFLKKKETMNSLLAKEFKQSSSGRNSVHVQALDSKGSIKSSRIRIESTFKDYVIDYDNYQDFKRELNKK
mmetsp:Transcript_20410/g.18070  ORF Transcript_20410/g.18070 Transcript_20410/m.18070 type:complete len:140 (+) Transcript_20410:218-637(+)